MIRVCWFGWWEHASRSCFFSSSACQVITRNGVYPEIFCFRFRHTHEMYLLISVLKLCKLGYWGVLVKQSWISHSKTLASKYGVREQISAKKRNRTLLWSALYIFSCLLLVRVGQGQRYLVLLLSVLILKNVSWCGYHLFSSYEMFWKFWSGYGSFFSRFKAGSIGQSRKQGRLQELGRVPYCDEQLLWQAANICD